MHNGTAPVLTTIKGYKSWLNISSLRLSLLYGGNKLTFINAIRMEFIDLTIASNFNSNRINSLQLSGETTMSDHGHQNCNVVKR